MKLVSAQTCEWHRTQRFLYTTEIREYQIIKYQIHFSKFEYLCTVFDTREEAENELARTGRGGWVEPFEWFELVTLHHRYIIREEGR